METMGGEGQRGLETHSLEGRDRVGLVQPCVARARPEGGFQSGKFMGRSSQEGLPEGEGIGAGDGKKLGLTTRG